MRLVFAGTPQTAVPALDALLASRHEVAAVVTRPDAPAGRGRKVEASPVARRAAEAGLEVLTPARARDPEFLDRLREIGPDCCPVAAYGALLPQAALDIPPHGWVNLHFSILPAWRGAAPVQHAILHGDDVTGASTFQIVKELDAGPVYGVLTEPVRPDDTTGTLLDRLSHPGAGLLVATLDGIEDGTIQAVPQPAEGVSFAPKISPADARVDWKRPAHVVDRQIRACTPEPGRLDRARRRPPQARPGVPGRPWFARPPRFTWRHGLAGPAARRATGRSPGGVRRYRLPPGPARRRPGPGQAPHDRLGLGPRPALRRPRAVRLTCPSTPSAHGHPDPAPASAGRRQDRSQPRTGQPAPASRPASPPSPRTDPARRAAYDVLRAVADRDAYANLLLPALLTERGLTGRDAAFATELTYGTLRGRGTYDAILAACSDRDELDPPVRDVLRLGAHQLLATRVGHHAAVATSVDLAKDVCGPRPSGFVNAVLRRVATRDLDAWVQIVAPDRSRDPSGYLAVRHSYPRWIVDAFRDALGTASAAETEDALAAGNVRPEVVLALSPRRPAARRPGLPLDGDRTRWSPYGFRLAGGDPAPLVASGQAAVQDEASQLAALALTRVGLAPWPRGPRRTRGPVAPVDGRDQLWLDLCAGPGGKARLLSGLAAARGARLVASDIRPHRARRVLEALRRGRRRGPRRPRRGRPPVAVVTGHVRPRPGRRPVLRPRVAAPPPRSQVAQDPRRRGGLPVCSASCSTRPSTRSGPAAWWPT